MANDLYVLARAAILRGEVNFLNDSIRAVLVDQADYTPSLAADEFLSAIPAAGRVSTSAPLTGKTVTGGVFDADDTLFDDAAGDPSELVVLYKDTGTAGTSRLLFLIDTATGLAVIPNGGDITLTFDNGANRIFAI